MADLYKGQAGSPITYLASDISANQTTISIADDSALPDAPNIATIGYGEQLETIKYETKSNGVLQNVTRGIEGTPRSWQAGTEVARFFTAYDHNSIIENFNSHLAENVYSGVQIVAQTVVTGEVKYYKSFGVVQIIVPHSTLESSLSGWSARGIMTLPAGFRPPEQIEFPLLSDNNILTVVIRISPNGNVSIMNRSNIAASTSEGFRGGATFPTSSVV